MTAESYDNILKLAAKLSIIQLAKYALDNGANPEMNRGYLLKNSPEYTIEMVKLLLKHDKQSKYANNIIIENAKHGLYAYFNVLITHYLASDQLDKTEILGLALTETAKYGNIRIVRMLIDLGANVDFDNGRPFIYACEYGCLDVAQLLIDHGADPNIDDNNALIFAVSANRYQSVLFLINLNANVNAQDGGRC